nr:hypothetical protein Iba_chr04eCG9060 [Ipomoea batatas]
MMLGKVFFPGLALMPSVRSSLGVDELCLLTRAKLLELIAKPEWWRREKSGEMEAADEEGDAEMWTTKTLINHPYRVNNHVKQIKSLGRSVDHEVPLHLLNSPVHPQILCLRNPHQNRLQVPNIFNLHRHRERFPVQNIAERGHEGLPPGSFSYTRMSSSLPLQRSRSRCLMWPCRPPAKKARMERLEGEGPPRRPTISPVLRLISVMAREHEVIEAEASIPEGMCGRNNVNIVGDGPADGVHVMGAVDVQIPNHYHHTERQEIHQRLVGIFSSEQVSLFHLVNEPAFCRVYAPAGSIVKDWGLPF